VRYTCKQASNMAVASEIGHIGGAETEEKDKEARRWTCVLEVGLHGGGDVAQTLERVEAAASRRPPGGAEQGLHGQILPIERGNQANFSPTAAADGRTGNPSLPLDCLVLVWWGFCFASFAVASTEGRVDDD